MEHRDIHHDDRPRGADHRFLLRQFRDCNAFKCLHPRLLVRDLYRDWCAAGLPEQRFQEALVELLVEGLADLIEVDGEHVVELTPEGVSRVWQMHSPGVAMKAVVGRWMRRLTGAPQASRAA